MLTDQSEKSVDEAKLGQLGAIQSSCFRCLYLRSAAARLRRNSWLRIEGGQKERTPEKELLRPHCALCLSGRQLGSDTVAGAEQERVEPVPRWQLTLPGCFSCPDKIA